MESLDGSSAGRYLGSTVIAYNADTRVARSALLAMNENFVHDAPADRRRSDI